MALFTLTTNAQSNQPASQIGDVSVELDYNETYTFVEADFTTGAVPEYKDPEGDALDSVIVKTLPGIGTVQYNSIDVQEDDVIPVSGFANFTYIPDALEIAGYNDSNMTWDAIDEGSGVAAGLVGKVNFSVAALINEPPSAVGDNNLTTSYGTTITFTVDDFTTDTTPAYADPEGDLAATLKIDSLPSEGTLQYQGVNVVLNDQIPFTGTPSIDNGDLTYIPNSSNSSQYSVSFNFSIADAGSGEFRS